MIIEAVAPTRIDLAGGTLDIYPIPLLEEEVITINLAITVLTHARLEPHGDGVAVFSQDLGVGVEAPSAAALPVGGPMDLALRAVRFSALPRRTRVVTRSDAPRGSGLGASSSLLVALLAACDRKRGRRGVRKDLVDVAARLEAQSIGALTGKQDYYSALHGGLNAIWLGLDGERVEPLLPQRRLKGLEEHLVLAFTGEPHSSGPTNWGMIRSYLDGIPETVRRFREIKRISRQMRDPLRTGDIRSVARLMREEWNQRRELAHGVTTPVVERALTVARKAGALAGKVCGAGGGGCVVNLVAAGRRDVVESALREAGFAIVTFAAARHGLRLTTRRSRSPITRRSRSLTTPRSRGRMRKGETA